MRAILQKIVYLGIMSRLPLAFAAVSNVWVMLLLGRRIEEAPRRGSFIVEAPLPLLLVFAAVIALGLHIYGVALNDLLHARYDRMFRPGRPIPSGRVQAAHAAVTAVVGLLVSLLATATCVPFVCSARTSPAATRIASALPTEVPPNLIMLSVVIGVW